MAILLACEDNVYIVLKSGEGGMAAMEHIYAIHYGILKLL